MRSARSCVRTILAIDQHAVAAIPVDRRAADGEVDRRHHAPPLHEPGEVREPVRIVHGDEIPLPLGPERTAPAEYAATQQHAVRGPTPLDGREVTRVRVVGVERVEDGWVPPVSSNRRCRVPGLRAQASSGIWHVTQLRPFVPCAWKYSPVRSTNPWVLKVAECPPGFFTGWLLSMLVSSPWAWAPHPKPMNSATTVTAARIRLPRLREMNRLIIVPPVGRAADVVEQVNKRIGRATRFRNGLWFRRPGRAHI